MRRGKVLTILWGLSGGGLRDALIDELACRASRGGRHFLLAPEQDSHEQERALCRRAGPGLSPRVEALTFGRLAARVLSETGGMAAPLLDEGGRLLMLRRALLLVADKLRLWREASARPDFWSLLLPVVDECKMYRVSPETLALSERSATGRAEDAFHDLNLILTAYDSLVGQLYLDPRDQLTRAAGALAGSSGARANSSGALAGSSGTLANSSCVGQGVTWAVCGFSRFTAQEKEVLSALLSGCDEVTVALIGSPGGGSPDGPEDSLFSVPRRTAGSLARLASRVGATAVSRVLPDTGGKNPALAHLSKHFLRMDAPAFRGEAERVETFCLPDAAAECAFAAARVRALTRDFGYRYRDISVTARDFGAYAPLFEREAARLDIPLFWDRKDDILQKPLFVFVTAAIDAATRGLPHDALFSMLKTGLFGLPPEACDRLENYAGAHNLKGSAWRAAEDWTLPPRGFGRPPSPEDEEDLRRLNDWRRQVVRPLHCLRRRAAGDKTVRGNALAVYRFLEEIQVPERLEARCRELAGLGELQYADQTRQMWDILCRALGQCVDLLDDAPATLSEFGDMLALLLSRVDVGSIPVALDRLSCGDADRVGHRSPRCVILLGATFMALPQPPPHAGLLNREERTLLRKCGAELAPDEDDHIANEWDIIYTAFTLPSERLIVTWPATDTPSFAVTEMQKLLRLPTASPGAWDAMGTQAAGPCLEWLAENPKGMLADAMRLAVADFPEISDRLSGLTSQAQDQVQPQSQPPSPSQGQAQTPTSSQPPAQPQSRPPAPSRPPSPWSRGQLPARAVDALFGETRALSPSRVETFMQCPYAYLLRYGFGVAPRPQAAFSAPDQGRFTHFVLENTLREVGRLGGVGAVPDDMARAIGRKAARTYIEETLQGHRWQTARTRYLYNRLEQAMDAVVTSVMAELRGGDFIPLDLELPLSAGIADRVDGWLDGGTLYLRVVDYKTGARPFRLDNAYHGLGLQMLLYLFALEREGPERYAKRGAKEVAPAGVLYLPAREAYLPIGPDASEEELRRAREKEWRRSGLVLDAPAVIEAMERDIAGTAAFLPVEYKKNASELTARSSVAGLADFARLRRHVDRLLRDMASSLQVGRLPVRPAGRGAWSSCQYCEFLPACQYDELTGDRPRLLRAMSKKEVWRRLEEAEEAEETGQAEQAAEVETEEGIL